LLGLEIVLYSCAIVAMLGAVVTAVCTLETRNKSLEEIEREHIEAKPWYLFFIFSFFHFFLFTLFYTYRWYYLPWSGDRRIQYDLMTQSQSTPDLTKA
jgi:hypothetical protein